MLINVLKMTLLPCVSPPSPAAIRVSVALYFSPGLRVKYCLMPSVTPPKRLPPITATVPAAGTISSPPRTEAPAPHAISKPLTGSCPSGRLPVASLSEAYLIVKVPHYGYLSPQFRMSMEKMWFLSPLSMDKKLNSLRSR